MFKSILHTKARTWLFIDNFSSQFISCGFNNRSKSWLQFRSNTIRNHKFYFYKVQEAALNIKKSVYSKIPWKHTDHHVFVAVEERKNFSTERFEGSVNLDLPFWGHLNIDLWIKTRPRKLVDVVCTTPWLPALYERMILRWKTVILGPLKSSKNMLRKLILIGLIVLNNNRTIEEPKILQGG